MKTFELLELGVNTLADCIIRSVRVVEVEWLVHLSCFSFRIIVIRLLNYHNGPQRGTERTYVDVYKCNPSDVKRKRKRTRDSEINSVCSQLFPVKLFQSLLPLDGLEPLSVKRFFNCEAI